MADASNNPTPPNKKDFDDANASLRLTEQMLTNVENRYQRLLVLQKAIQLKIVDPKDVKNFERFLKEISTADFSNLNEIKKIGGYLGDGAKRMSDLVDYASHLNKNTESYAKNLIDQNKEYSQINSNAERLVKSQKKSNDESKRAISNVEEFLEGYKDVLSNYDLTVDVQGKVLDGLNKLRKGQDANIGLANAFSGTYSDLAANLGNAISNMGDFRPNISPVFEFDFLEGVQSEFRERMNDIISSAGKPTVEIGGMEIPENLKTDVFNGLKGLYEGAYNKSAEVQNGVFNALASDISKSFGMSKDVALGLVEDLIKDQAALIEGVPSILSSDRQKEVQKFYQQIQNSGDAALKTIIGYTISAKMAVNTMTADVNKMSEQIKAVPRLDQAFEGFKDTANDIISQLQYTTEGLMPRWMSSALGVNKAFDSIRDTASVAIQQLLSDLATGKNRMQALSTFTSTFSSGLLGALGPLTLIVISIASLWKMMTSAGESAKELSKEFGVSRSTAVDMHKSILGMTSAIENTSLKQEDVLEVLKKHRDEYGLIMDLNNKANQEAVKFAAELGKQYGIGAGEAYDFTQQLQQLGADKAASEEIAAVAAHASNLAGIPFSTITKDLAESSEFVATQFAGMPQKAVATAAKLRAMGTSLKSVEKAMEKAFDTKNFLQGMTELNIMTRGVVDLSEMFRRSMAGDVAGTATEVAKQFDKMVASGQTNMFQMRQFAQVTGYSVEELQRGNKIRRESAKLGKDNVELLSRYLDKLSDADVADAKSAMKAAKRLGAAEKLDSIWASIKDTLTEALMPALEGISDLIVAIAPALKIIGLLFKGIGIVIKGIAAPIALVVDLVNGIGDMFKGNMPQFERIKSLFGEWDGILGSIANGISIIIGGIASVKMLSAVSKMVGGFEGMRKTLKGMGTSIQGLGPSLQKAFATLRGQGSILGKLKDGFKGMFSGADTGESFFEKIKGNIKGLFKGTADAASPEAPDGGEKQKSLLDKGIDKVKDMFGMGKEAAADPLTAPADALKEAADALKEAASTLSQCPCPGGSALDRGKKRGRASRRRSTGGRTGGKGRAQSAAKTRTTRAAKPATPKVKTPANQIEPKSTTPKVKTPANQIEPKSTTPKVKTPANQIEPKSTTPKYRDPKTGRFASKPVTTPATSTGSKAGTMLDKAKSGGKNLLSKGKDLVKPGNLLKGVKALNPAGLASAVAGIGTSMIADKYEAKAMETGDKGDLNIARTAKVGGAALQGAGYGAMLGSIVPGLGTAVGGAVGGVIGGAIGVWENFFSDDAKKQNEQLKQMKAGNKILNGLTDLTESEMQQLKDAGYSDDVIKKISEGNVSLEQALKEQFSEFNLNEDQLKKLADPNTTGKERDIIMQTAAGIPPPSLSVGTNLVKSDGLAMLHQGEAVIPAKVIQGGFKLSPESIGTPETIAKPSQQRVTPVSNDMTQLSKPETVKSQSSIDYDSPPPVSRGSGNQDALLKQLMTVMQDVANRPVQVQIAGVELKALNSKMKVLNNKA